MPTKRRPQKGRPNAKRGGRTPGVTARKIAGGAAWVLVHPRCAVDRVEDIEEVRLMVDAGEYEVATEELRWLLSGCSELMDGHVLLGDLAVASSDTGEPDLVLARGHYGFAYELGLKALKHAGADGPLPAAQAANRPLHEAARGLAWCFEKLGRGPTADEIVATVRGWDAEDPLGVAALIDELRSDGLPVVGLG